MACMDICPLASELSVVNSNITCPEEGCAKVFKASSALNMHLTKHHRNSCLMKRDSSVTARYFCPEETCVYHIKASRHFTQMKYLKQHYLKVHSEKRFSCESCKKGFATQDLLRYHLQVCGIKYLCSCGNSYSSYEALLTHSKRKQHWFDDKFKSGNKRTKPESLTESVIRKDTHCFSVDMMQPIYILPKPLLDQQGTAVTVLTPSSLKDESTKATALQDKGMQTDPFEPKRRKTYSPTKVFDRNSKRRASAQTQTGSGLKCHRSKKTAETQTVGDYILKKAMADAEILSPTCNNTSQLPISSTRRRKYNSGTQTAARKGVKVSPALLDSPHQPSGQEIVMVPPEGSFCLRKDIGLPDLWLVDKSSSSTQTYSIGSGSLLQSESYQSVNEIHSDLTLELFSQDGSLCTSTNLQSIFEDNSNSFDNEANNSTNFCPGRDSETLNSLHHLPSEGFTSCNVTETDQNLNHLFPRPTCDDEGSVPFTMRTTSETQTTDDLADLDSLLYTNMWTQTSEDSLFSGLDFADIQTQTVWPSFGDEDSESILVSAETQTSISSSTFGGNSPAYQQVSWSNMLSHIETQTCEQDLEDLMEELEAT